MARSEREVVTRLGTGGLMRVVSDLLDHARVIRLANAVGLSYPGMRTQSQKRSRLIADLADKAGRDDAATLAVVRLLRKETVAMAKEWASLAPAVRVARLTNPGVEGGNGRLGAYLFVAASAAPEPPVEEALSGLLSSMGTTASESAAAPQPGAKESPVKEAQRLRKRCAELQKKVRYLEGQIAKTKDIEKTYKRDLLQRKGELAEARMLAERLRRELEELRGAVEAPAAAKASAALPGFDELERSVKRLVAEQRRLAHRIETTSAAPGPPPPQIADAVTPLANTLTELQREVAALRRERKKDIQDQARRLDEVAAGVLAAKNALEASPKASRAAARKKGEPERVGIFIDVQNMYYSARQLKGKLDFDALIQGCVLDRRLIQASAYVVESKEIDQSGFIAMLQQRAIEVRRKTLKVRADGSMKGDWDMEMALDILDMAPKLDVVVLVSGDGDFTSLVKRVKTMGPKVEVVAFPRNTAKSLLEAADRFHALDRRSMIRTESAAGDTERSAPPAEPSPEGAPQAILVREGRIIACASQEPSDMLGHFLVSRGKISEETLRNALAQQETNKTHLGKILVAAGALTEDELRVLLEIKAQETIFGLFDWDDAEFRFTDGETADANILAVNMRVEDVLLRGAQRWDEMKRFRAVFNDPGIVLKRTARMPPAEVFRNRMARRIFESINGDRTVAEILLHAHGSEYLVTKFLFELHRAGVAEVAGVKPVGPDAAPPPVAEEDLLPEPPPRTAVRPTPKAKAAAPAALAASPAPAAIPVDVGDLEFARRLLNRGEFDSALEILDRAYKAQPGDEALRRLLAEAEASFVEKAYRHYLPPSWVVTLSVAMSSVTAEHLSPTEFFLLSRIDGTWDVKSIIQITPLREVDVLRSLKRLREKGLIALKDPVAAPA